MRNILVIVAVMTLLLSCSENNSKDKANAEEPSIMVFSAASLTDVLLEVIDSFEVKYHVKVKVNMASSGTLARQIEQGGIPDVYISASKKWADYVDTLGYIQDGYKLNIAKNELVLIAPLNSNIEVQKVDSSLDLVSLLGSGRLSMGDPAHVPAGRYAKQVLDYFGWYQSLDKRILPAKDVRSALMVVEMGESPLGIVYRTDAQKSSKVKILNTLPEHSHKPVVYVAGVCSENKVAKDFFAYLNSEETNSIWMKYGFKK